MKRTPLRRRAPLKRSALVRAVSDAVATFRVAGRGPKRVKPMRAGRSQTKHARRERAPESWWLFVKQLPCFVAVTYAGTGARPRTPCSREPLRDADHMGNRFSQGDGTRAHDWTCAPMCHDHHMERHALTGAFKGFTGEHMRAFCASAVEWTHNRARAAGIVIPDV